jgi:hypothetical protein
MFLIDATIVPSAPGLLFPDRTQPGSPRSVHAILCQQIIHPAVLPGQLRQHHISVPQRQRSLHFLPANQRNLQKPETGRPELWLE